MSINEENKYINEQTSELVKLQREKLELDKLKFQARQRAQRNFFAAASQGRLVQDWITSTLSPNKETQSDLKTIRSRARDLNKNSSIVSHYVKILQDCVIGAAGFTLQSNVANSRGSTNNKISNQIEQAWVDFSKAYNIDITGKSNLSELLNTMVQSLAVDGEILVRKINGFGKYGLQLQILDADYLSQVPSSTFNGNDVIQGVELNKYGKPIAYHLYTKHPSEGGQSLERIPAEQIIHIFKPHRAGATRGISWLAPVMPTIQQWEKYKEAEVIAARMAACKSVYFTTEDDDAYEGTGQAVEPGSAETLPPGVKVVSIDPTHPNSAFPEFQKALLKEIAAGLGVSYSTLLYDYSSDSYSSSRTALIQEKRFFQSVQAMLVDKVLAPLFEEWIETACVTKAVVLPAVGGSFNLYKTHSFISQGFPYMDLYKEAQAQVLMLDKSLTTRTDILAESGRDFEELLMKKQKEKDLLSQYGLTEKDLDTSIPKVDTAIDKPIAEPSGNNVSNLEN